MTNEWLRQFRSAFRREAQKECASCQGRKYGDCSDGCLYFRITATASELEEAKRGDTSFKARGFHSWAGSRHGSLDTV